MMRKVLALGALSAAMATMAHAQIPNELARGEFFSWKLNSGVYSLTGFITLNGTVGSQSPVSFRFTDANNDGLALDVVLDLGELLSDIAQGIDLQAPLTASIVQDNGTSAIIRWYGRVVLDQNDQRYCIRVRIPDGPELDVRFTEIEGSLQGLVDRISCQADPLEELPQNVHLRITPNGGDSLNFLKVKGYAFCLVQQFTALEANVTNIAWIGYGGGLPKSLGNVNGDCTIDDADLLQVLFNFGSNDTDTDTNGDGTVDDADLLTVLFNFGLSV